jgi:hypothetical protein
MINRGLPRFDFARLMSFSKLARIILPDRTPWAAPPWATNWTSNAHTTRGRVDIRDRRDQLQSADLHTPAGLEIEPPPRSGQVGWGPAPKVVRTAGWWTLPSPSQPPNLTKGLPPRQSTPRPEHLTLCGKQDKCLFKAKTRCPLWAGVCGQEDKPCTVFNFPSLAPITTESSLSYLCTSAGSSSLFVGLPAWL